VSAKTGEGIEEVLEAIVERVPPPPDEGGPLQALIFDSWYDQYLGVVVLARVMSGTIEKGTKLRFWASKEVYECASLGVYTPFATEVKQLCTGEVGIVAASIKDIAHARVGDTITDDDAPGFGAASSACCTWRSSRSASSASTTWI
jgi:GTP-binding protein LepA